MTDMITIDGIEYSIDELTEKQKESVVTLQDGEEAMRILSHIGQCVQAVQSAKLQELKKELEDNA